jgi:hypothetical protein
VKHAKHNRQSGGTRLADTIRRVPNPEIHFALSQNTIRRKRDFLKPILFSTEIGDSVVDVLKAHAGCR